MYVLRDIKVKYKDLKAQIDYVIITPVYTYFVECKNLVGNITVNEKGDFIREITLNGKKIRKGMYSPLRQVEAQREVVRKIWESNSSKIKVLFGSNSFDNYQRVLVVAANQETILNTSKAPNDIKYKILRADNLVRQIEYDLNHIKDDEIYFTTKEIKAKADNYLLMNVVEEIDYYKYYKEKYCNIDESFDLRSNLTEFRTKRSREMNIPAYYIFTNEELDLIIKNKPKTINELNNILSDIKIKTHGKLIVELINKGE